MRFQAFLLSAISLLTCLPSGDLLTTPRLNLPREHGLVKAYYPSYHYNGQTPSQINYSLYTDLIFFSVEPAANHEIKYNYKLTREQGEKLAIEMVAHARTQKVKALLSFGGWIGSRYFSTYTSTDSERKKFAQSIVSFTRRLGFDGIELDWEHPHSLGIGCNSQSPQDVVHYGLLVKEIRALWPEVQISAAVAITGLTGAKGSPASIFETFDLIENLNYVNLMAYDVFGAWSTTTGPLAPLHATCAPAGAAQSVETGLKTLIDQGFKPEQIVLGIPGYSKRFELTSRELVVTTVHGHASYYYQPHTKVTPRGGKFDDSPMINVCGVQESWGGSFLTKELVSNGWLSQDQRTGLNGYKRHFDECSGQPFLTDGKYLITYDDEDSSVSKARFAKANKLAGIYFFDTQGPLDSTVQAAGQALRSR